MPRRNDRSRPSRWRRFVEALQAREQEGTGVPVQQITTTPKQQKLGTSDSSYANWTRHKCAAHQLCWCAVAASLHAIDMCVMSLEACIGTIVLFLRSERCHHHAGRARYPFAPWYHLQDVRRFLLQPRGELFRTQHGRWEDGTKIGLN